MSHPANWLVLLAAASLLGNVVLGFLLVRAARLRDRTQAYSLQWSIGILEGASPFALGEPAAGSNPVLTARDVTDVRADFVADPFMMREGSEWFMFFEIMESRRGRGSIGLATSSDGRRWKYGKVVLREPFHLSYPLVFREGSDVYMVPECAKSGAIRLYRARRFPDDWVFERTLRTGPHVDATLFAHGGKWWMFTSTASHDELRLHRAETLDGPWTEHPSSPIVRGNPHVARPAGRVVVADGRTFRFAQDDEPTYGIRVFAFEITRLDETTYSEVPVGDRPILAGSGFGWNSYKIHHVDAHRVAPDRWMACVDGKGFPLDVRKPPSENAAGDAKRPV